MPSEVAIAVNVSADSLLQPVVQAALAGDLRNVIVEITEEATTQPSSAVLSALAGLRSAGAVIAVDDVSTGHAGLVRLSRIRPDIIKLDRSLTAGATRGDEHVAVIETLVDLARRLGSAVLAEGVESTRDLPALTQLGIDYVQGWATGPPTPTWQPVPPDVIDACLQARQSLLRVSAGREQVDVFHRAILALVTCSRRSQFQTALAQATEALSATNIGVSLLNGHNSLHEVAATGNAPDPAEYSLTDYPATAAALREARILEVYIDEPDADPAEVSALRKNDVTSLLLIPLYVERVPLGVLEISRRQARRYSTADIASARRLADHVAQALARLS
jgi:hypothetical protein